MLSQIGRHALGHHHDHGHGHGHGHHHHHHHVDATGRLGVAFGLNVSFTLVELVGAWLTGSTAIAADALHDLGDSLSLALAWGLQGWSGKEPTSTFSYGFRRLSLAGAFVNALVLLVGGLVVLRAAVPRLTDPGDPHVPGMIGLAVLGVLVNGAAAWRVGRGESLNEKVVTWHLLEDVLGWVAVLVVSLVMWVVELPILDPLLSVAITLWVGWHAAVHLKATVDVFLQAVPEGVDVDALAAEAREVEGVVDLLHVHVWSQDGSTHVLTGDLVVDCVDLAQAIGLRDAVVRRLEHHGIAHVTLQLTTDPAHASTCA
jgi:cobalt-zinc-cadmium efflux system protein